MMVAVGIIVVVEVLEILLACPIEPVELRGKLHRSIF